MGKRKIPDKISYFATLCVAAYMCGNLCISPTSLDAIVGFELAAAASSSDDGLGRHLLSVRNGSVLNTNIVV